MSFRLATRWRCRGVAAPREGVGALCPFLQPCPTHLSRRVPTLSPSQSARTASNASPRSASHFNELSHLRRRTPGFTASGSECRGPPGPAPGVWSGGTFWDEPFTCGVCVDPGPTASELQRSVPWPETDQR